MICRLNENIRQLRQNQGLNQVELAQKLNVSKQCVSNWENDNILPSIEMLCRIAEFFNVSTDFLLGREEGAYINVKGLSENEQAHIRFIVSDLLKNKR